MFINHETKGSEGACIGITKFPFEDISYKTSSDLWVYRTYSGLVYHAGTQTSEEIFESFTQGDYVTCILDLKSRTLMFGKNGEVRSIEHHFRYLVSPIRGPLSLFESFIFFRPPTVCYSNPLF